MSGFPADSRRILLHVGCGNDGQEALPPLNYAQEWREIRVDIDPAVKPDVLASITDLAGVPDQSVSIVYSKHNLEHVEAHQVGAVLASFHRVLRPDGFAVIRTPDLERVAELILEIGLETQIMTAWGHPVGPIDMIYGLRGAIAEGNHFMAHRTGFTRQTLHRHLVAAGFQSAKVDRRPAIYELGAIAMKVEAGNIFPLVVHQLGGR